MTATPWGKGGSSDINPVASTEDGWSALPNKGAALFWRFVALAFPFLLKSMSSKILLCSFWNSVITSEECLINSITLVIKHTLRFYKLSSSFVMDTKLTTLKVVFWHVLFKKVNCQMPKSSSKFCTVYEVQAVCLQDISLKKVNKFYHRKFELLTNIVYYFKNWTSVAWVMIHFHWNIGW